MTVHSDSTRLIALIADPHAMPRFEELAAEVACDRIRAHAVIEDLAAITAGLARSIGNLATTDPDAWTDQFLAHLNDKTAER